MPAWLIVIVVIVVIVLLLLAVNSGDIEWLSLFEVLDCCSVFGVLLLASVVMFGGLVFWHSLLLVAGAGASLLTLLLLGWASTLRKHFLATRSESL